jgi:hypothetical protein
MNRKTDERRTHGDSTGSIADFRMHNASRETGEDGATQRPAGNGHAQRQKLPPEVHAFLGHRLRKAYSDLVNEPVPRVLLDLLDRLKAQEHGAHGDAGLGQETSEAKEKA